VSEYVVYISLICTAGEPVVMGWSFHRGEIQIHWLMPISETSLELE
jgi:hypothetical protein